MFHAARPLGQVIEGGELPRDVRGLVISGRTRGAQAQLACLPDQIRQDRQRVQTRCILRAVTQRGVSRAAHLVTYGEAISEEQEVEQPLLHHTGRARVVLGVEVVTNGFRVTPGRVTVNDRPGQQKRRQVNLTTHEYAPAYLALGTQTAMSDTFSGLGISLAS